MSDHAERKPLLHEGPLRLLAKNLMDSVKQKDAEIERLKGELAEALAAIRMIDSYLPRREWEGMDAIETRYKLVKEIARAFLQKHTTLSHGKVVFERYVIGEGGKMSVERPVAPAEPIPPPLNCGSAAAGESPSHSGGGVKCEPDCRMCSGEYCKIHLNKPCDCDCLDRHGIFQDQKQQKPGGAS